jgi:hypothetical protein
MTLDIDPEDDAVLVLDRRPGIQIASPPDLPPAQPHPAAALVRDDGEEPRPHPVAPFGELVELPPGEECGLLNGVLRLVVVGEDGVGKPEGLPEERAQPVLERRLGAHHLGGRWPCRRELGRHQESGVIGDRRGPDERMVCTSCVLGWPESPGLCARIAVSLR